MVHEGEWFRRAVFGKKIERGEARGCFLRGLL